MKPKATAILEFAILALVLALFLWWTHFNYSEEINNQLIAVSTSTAHIISFPDVEIKAESAYIYDLQTNKVLFSKNADTIRPLASLTKIITTITASNLLPNYILVRITPEDIMQEGDSGLLLNEEWNVKKLIDYSLIVSSNDGMYAIANVAGSQINISTTTSPEKLFVNQMNETVKKLGLKTMSFFNPTGLDESKTLSGGYGSAKDMAMLFKYILKNKPNLLEATTLSKTIISSEQEPHIAINTDKSINNIPNIIASKTGYTDLSNGNLVVAFNAGLNHPIIISVLGSSYDGRFTDIDNLVKAVFYYLSQKENSK